MAERGGFEPPMPLARHNGFRDRRFQPAQPPLRKRAEREDADTRSSGGEGGIRTHETGYPRLRDFQSRSLSQLGHLSAPAFGKATVYRRGLASDRGPRAEPQGRQRPASRPIRRTDCRIGVVGYDAPGEMVRTSTASRPVFE